MFERNYHISKRLSENSGASAHTSQMWTPTGYNTSILLPSSERRVWNMNINVKMTKLHLDET